MSLPDPTEYLSAVRAAIDNGQRTVERYLTTVCPECGIRPVPVDGEHHLIGPYVIVGCEGYLVVDPNLVGVTAPNWQPIDPTTAGPGRADNDDRGRPDAAANASEHDAR